MGDERIDFASRVIKASREDIYRAFVDPKALVSWLPPDGMSAEVQAFDARPGGTYRMTLRYERPEHRTRGKTSEDSDVVEGSFAELVPNERIVQLVTFASDDPAFAGVMKMTWSLTAVPGGTEVEIRCEDVPSGIRKEDHDVGLRSSLDNLAKFVE